MTGQNCKYPNGACLSTCQVRQKLSSWTFNLHEGREHAPRMGEEVGSLSKNVMR